MRKWFLICLLSLALLGADKAPPVRVEVVIFLDANGDRLMNDGEGIQGMPVLLKINDDVRTAGLTEDGRVTFPLNYSLGDDSRIQVEIPYLAAAQKVSPNGDTDTLRVAFRLEAPELPVYLP